MIDLILKVNGVEYTLADIAKFYSIAETAQQLKIIQEQAESQAKFYLEQLARIEPDAEKQQLAIQIVLAVREQLPVIINI